MIVILMMMMRSGKRCEVMKCRGFLQIPPMLLRTSHTPFDDDPYHGDEDGGDDDVFMMMLIVKMTTVHQLGDHIKFFDQ